MMFARDRDIAQVEPGAHRDLLWLGQVLVRGTGSVGVGAGAHNRLLATAQELNFASPPIEAGMIVVVSGVSLEVTGVVAQNQLGVSRLRVPGAPAGEAIEVASGPFHVVTFQPQIAWVHAQVMAMLGMRPAWAAEDSARLPAARITNGDELVRIEVLGALHTLYAAAGAALASDHPLNQRASMYRRLFAEERQRVVARIDADGDGDADVLRRPNVGWMVRG